MPGRKGRKICVRIVRSVRTRQNVERPKRSRQSRHARFVAPTKRELPRTLPSPRMGPAGFQHRDSAFANDHVKG